MLPQTLTTDFLLNYVAVLVFVTSFFDLLLLVVCTYGPTLFYFHSFTFVRLPEV